MIENQTANYKLQNNFQSSKEQRLNGRGKVYDIRERILNFSIEVLKICKRLPAIPECGVIRKQLSRAATSIGANYEEADGALTKKDFINKVAIARKEAKETRYWIRLVQNSFMPTREVDSLLREIEEIISILSAIIIKCG